jgi:hypothetical protein
VAKSFLLKPDDIVKRLRQRYNKQHKQWLSGTENWPQSLPLGCPTERQAFEYLNDVQNWQKLWLDWNGEGEIQWVERHWSKLGKQKLPEKISIHDPIQITRWIGEEQTWTKVTQRYQTLTKKWPCLTQILPKYFKILKDYDERDFHRLFTVLEWLEKHPNSNLYIRQLPIEAVHTKWLLSRKSMVAEFIKIIRDCDDTNFYRITGLRQEPTLIRIRLLDSHLRGCIGGLGDLSISLEYLEKLTLPVKKIYIVENLQTGLAFNDISESIVFMGLGYSVDLLSTVSLLDGVPIYYWGDIDTDGFAILNRLRNHFPQAQSLLMDESTLLEHRNLWGTDEKSKTVTNLPMLTKEEKKLYDDLYNHRWIKNLRLEQEHISWSYAWGKLSSV